MNFMKLRQIHNLHFEFIQKRNKIKKLPKEQVKEELEKLKDEFIKKVEDVLLFRK